MDLTSKIEALLGILALLPTGAIFLVTYSWAYPMAGYYSYWNTDPEPIRTLGILVLIIAALSIIQGFETSFFEMTLGLLILLYMILALSWFFPYGRGGAHYNFFEYVEVNFTDVQLIFYASVGIALESVMIAHGIYKGKKSEYEPDVTS